MPVNALLAGVTSLAGGREEAYITVMASQKESIHITFPKDSPDLEPDGYLEGHLLIATPTVRGKVFAQTVIYLFAHNAQGAMGVIVNKPLDMVHYGSILQQLGIDVSAVTRDVPVHFGGPVDEHRGFVLHSDDYLNEDSLEQGNGVALTASTSVLKDLACGQGPKDARLMIGYAGWGAGQLEHELEQGSWISLPATPELLFSAPDAAKWALSAQTLGVDMSRYSPFVGHA